MRDLVKNWPCVSIGLAFGLWMSVPVVVYVVLFVNA